MVLNQSDESTQVSGCLGGFVSCRAFAGFSATKRPPSILIRNLPKQFGCIARMNAETPTRLKHMWHAGCCQMLAAPYRPSVSHVPTMVETHHNCKCWTGQARDDVGLCQMSVQLDPSVMSHRALLVASSCFPSMKRVCTPFVASSMYLALRDSHG